MSAGQTTRSFAEWQQQAQKMRAIADRSRQSRHAAMNRACREAGIGDYHGSVVHNAMIGLRVGKPWPEVDYSALRRAVRIESTLFEASRIVDRWSQRTFVEVVARVDSHAIVGCKVVAS